MLDLILPNTIEIIKETIKRDTGNDMNLELEQSTNEYQMYINKDTGSKYLVQVSVKFDLFGFQCYKDTFPQANAYIYIGTKFIMIHFGDALVNDWKISGEWSQNKYAQNDPEYWWTSSFLLFNRIGGLIYDYKDGTLVDKKLEG